jgi:hypothetical protein
MREFLQDKVVPDVVEGRERHAAHDDGTKMIIPLVQSPKNIEDEVMIRDVQPRSARESVMLFILRQYSLTERSPWTKLRSVASR